MQLHLLIKIWALKIKVCKILELADINVTFFIFKFFISLWIIELSNWDVYFSSPYMYSYIFKSTMQCKHKNMWKLRYKISYYMKTINVTGEKFCDKPRKFNKIRLNLFSEIKDFPDENWKGMIYFFQQSNIIRKRKRRKRQQK